MERCESLRKDVARRAKVDVSDVNRFIGDYLTMKKNMSKLFSVNSTILVDLMYLFVLPEIYERKGSIIDGKVSNEK